MIFKRSQTSQTTSKEFSSFKNILPASPNKTSSAQTHKYPQNTYQIQSQHQFPMTWVNQHPTTPQTTKTNENPSPSSSMHKLVSFGSKLVPIGSYGFFSSQIGYKLKNGFLTVHLHIHCSKIGLKMFK